ncbi:hypothetical protein BDW22DRAFT_1486895 [Trametopsis cervina]|nr:hypothetical protein BDW22DRAFT_1486895 [Trametopsis cervina]
MDQDSFRKLLQTPGSRSATAGKTYNSKSASSAPAAKKSKTKKADPAQPAFKPRAVTKDQYRDRALERRHGVAGDYAQVEALAEDFERRNADQDREKLEEQRRYLGGDSEHTVLVKGLDFALLEQNKAKAAAATEDDDTLEQAFIEGSSTLPKKRTREDIVASLKNKRSKGSGGPVEGKDPTSDAAALEEAKKAGKFKPIGFKPIGGSEGKGKKKVVKKVKGAKSAAKNAPKDLGDDTSGERKNEEPPPAATAEVGAASTKPPPPEPEPVDEDFDIFAGAGEYTGLDLSDDEDGEKSDNEPGAVNEETAPEVPDSVPKRKWFDTEEPHAPTDTIEKSTSRNASVAPPTIPAEIEDGEEPEEEPPARLAPLASTAVPSIRELLAADDEEAKQEKRRAKKEKKKGQLSTAGKVDRDYQRLKAYTEKKSGGPS